MSIKKLEDGRYLLDIRPNGRKGKRVRKVFDKKSVAVATERYIMANAEKREYIQGYRDRRTLMICLSCGGCITASTGVRRKKTENNCAT